MIDKGSIALDEFYSSVPIHIWRQVLGDQMHYHHGIWNSDEDWETALENTEPLLNRWQVASVGSIRV